MSVRWPGCDRSPGRAPLVAPVVLAVLLLNGLVAPARAAVAAPSPDDVLPAVTHVLSGRDFTAVFGVVVAQQLHRPAPWMSARAAEAQSARAQSSVATNGRRASRPFPSASLVKLFIAEDLLHRARAGDVRLGTGDLRTMRRMIRSSDDAAASSLWVRFKGDRMVRDVARRYGLTGTAPPRRPGQWGETVVTARDLARFLSLLPVVAHPDDADRLLGWMRSATARASDGFDQRFGLYGLTDSTAVKQGWMCCVGGRRHLHSVGVVGDTVVVLLGEVDRGMDYGRVGRLLTQAAAEVPAPRRS